MGPIEEPFGYSKQQRPAGTLSPPPRIRFPGNHLLLLEAIARHNGQVIHPLRLLARETATRPRQPLVFSIASTRQRKTNTRLRTTVPLADTPPPIPMQQHKHKQCVTPRVTLRPEIVPPVNRPPPPTFFLTIAGVVPLPLDSLPIAIDHPSSSACHGMERSIFRFDSTWCQNEERSCVDLSFKGTFMSNIEIRIRRF